MWSYRAWRRRRILSRSPYAQEQWVAAFAALPLLQPLSGEERERLRELAILFLHDKSIEPAGGLQLDDAMRLAVALLACLPILNLGTEWYRGWSTLLIYPGAFIAERTEFDEAGVEHHIREPLAGESWEHGPLIVGWEDVLAGARCEGWNVLIHELAHKLDLLDGAVNGLPPLHREMDRATWTQVFSAAYKDLQERVERGEETEIDPYAAEDPGEFFAVLSEFFFEQPRLLAAVYPEVYEQLAAFYRQDPSARPPCDG